MDREFDQLITDIDDAQHNERKIEDEDDGQIETEELMDEYNDWHDRLVAESSTKVALISTEEVLDQNQAKDVLKEVFDSHEEEVSKDLSTCLEKSKNAVTFPPSTVVSKKVKDKIVKVDEEPEEIVLEEEVTEQEITFLFTWPKHLPKPPKSKSGEPFREIHLRRVTRIKDIDLIVEEEPQIECKERGKIVDSQNNSLKYCKKKLKKKDICETDDENIQVKNVVFKKQILTPSQNAEKVDEQSSSEEDLKKSCKVTQL